MKKIRVFRTHIEIYPYKEGECKQLEYMLSIWNPHTFSSNKIGYTINDETLYIPRGVSPIFLEKAFGSEPMIEYSSDPYKFMKEHPVPLVEPKDDIQRDSINFLTSSGNFARGARYAQLSLNADTGEGKTYCTIYTICQLGMRALIITHIDKIKRQWMSTCSTMFSFSQKSQVDIVGTAQMESIIADDNMPKGDIFFINHQTINAFVRKHGCEKLHDFFIKLNIGIKVFDEAHLEFKNIIMVDMFSNTFKTIYLTANFNRSQPEESKLFQRAFSNVMKFSTNSKEYAEKRRHIVYVPVLFSSNCPEYQSMMLKNNYGFDSKRYIDYALKTDEGNNLIHEIHTVIKKTSHLDGRILIVTPKIESCEFIKDYLEYNISDKTIMTIHSKNSEENNFIAKNNADIIISTMKSVGTGVDIKGLRILINTEPYASSITANQMSGRLREYAPDKDTYYFDLVDVSIQRCYEMYKTRLRFLKKKCKEVILRK